VAPRSWNWPRFRGWAAVSCGAGACDCCPHRSPNVCAAIRQCELEKSESNYKTEVSSDDPPASSSASWEPEVAPWWLPKLQWLQLWQLWAVVLRRRCDVWMPRQSCSSGSARAVGVAGALPEAAAEAVAHRRCN